MECWLDTGLYFDLVPLANIFYHSFWNKQQIIIIIIIIITRYERGHFEVVGTGEVEEHIFFKWLYSPNFKVR